jgi:hypothetical protein
VKKNTHSTTKLTGKTVAETKYNVFLFQNYEEVKDTTPTQRKKNGSTHIFETLSS